MNSCGYVVSEAIHRKNLYIYIYTYIFAGIALGRQLLLAGNTQATRRHPCDCGHQHAMNST